MRRWCGLGGVLLIVFGCCAGADDLAGTAPRGFAEAVTRAAPAIAAAKPRRARHLLIYGRAPTHADAAGMARVMVEVLGKKTGAFATTLASDPGVFEAASLKRFDAVVMNNTHEADPFVPWGFRALPADQQAAAKEKARLYLQNLLDFVEAGHGLVGLHAATAGVKSDLYNRLMGGRYQSHLGGEVFLKIAEPGHPLCRALGARGLKVSDEIYVFGAPYSRDQVRVLVSIDTRRTQQKQITPGGDYPVSWIRTQGKGRVFYSSIPAHNGGSYRNPQLLGYILAGIQFALGDLDADASPRPAGR